MSTQHSQKTPVAVHSGSTTPIPPGRITEFSLPTSHGYSRIGGITAGPDGNLWFTQVNAIGRISPNGTITEFPLPSSNGKRVNEDDPNESGGGITAGPDGNLWFTEANTYKIGQITSGK